MRRIWLAALFAIASAGLAHAQCVGSRGAPFNCATGATPQPNDVVMGGQTANGKSVQWTWNQIFNSPAFQSGLNFNGANITNGTFAGGTLSGTLSGNPNFAGSPTGNAGGFTVQPHGWTSPLGLNQALTLGPTVPTNPVFSYPNTPFALNFNGPNAPSYMQTKSQVYPTIDGLPLGSIGPTGTPQAGYILAGGDDFTSQALSVACSSTPLGRYFDTRGYQFFKGTYNGARAGGDGGTAQLIMYDVGPCHTGWMDSNNGIAVSTWQDMMTQEKGVLDLGTRLAMPAEIAESFALQPAVGAMIQTAGFLVAKPPYIVDALIRTAQGLNTRGSGWHPSMMWIGQTGGINLDTNTLLGGIATCQENEVDVYEGDNGAQRAVPTFYDWVYGDGTHCPGSPGVVVPNSATQITGASFDSSWHRLTLQVLGTGITYWFDGNLVWPLTRDMTTKGDRPSYFLFTNHLLQTGFSATNWGNYGPSGAHIKVKEWRVWVPSSGVVMAPVVAQPDVNIPWTGPWPYTFTLPSKQTVWGTSSSSVIDALEAIPHEAEGPDANYQGSWWGVPCTAAEVTGCQGNQQGFSTVKNNDGTITVTLQQPTGPGRFYMGRYAWPSGWTTGGATYPQRFAINVGPTFQSPTSMAGQQGMPWEWQFYRDCNSGDLLKNVSLTSSLQSGWQWKIPHTGIPTNFYRNGGRASSGTVNLLASTPVTFTLACANDPGQSMSRTFTIAPYTQGAGVPAPALTNRTLIGSLDFSNLSSLTLNGSTISAAAGVDGTSYGATQATSANQPASTQVTAAWGVRGQNLGNATIGTVTTSSPTYGQYSLTATSSTQWTVVDPTGTALGTATQGTPFTGGGVTFTITTGGVATVTGDTYLVKVVQSYGAVFNGTTSDMDWTSLITGAGSNFTTGGGEFTIVMVAQTSAPSTAATLLDFAQGAAAATTNRTAVLETNACGTGINSYLLRTGGATTTSLCYAPSATGTNQPQIIVTRRGAGATQGDLEMQVDVAGGNYPGYGSPTTADKPATLDTGTIGARKVTSAIGNFFPGTIYRVLVYNSFLTDAELETLLIWGANNYGTAMP